MSGLDRPAVDAAVALSGDRGVDKSEFKDQKRPKGLSPFLKYGPAVAHAIDGATTQRMLNLRDDEGRPMIREANPVLAPFADQPVAMYATKILGALALSALADRMAKHGDSLEQRGHKGWGKTFKGAAKIGSALNIGAPLAAAAHNTVITERLR